MQENLRAVLSKITPISNNDWNDFQSILSIKDFKKGDFLLKEGQYSKGTHFIAAGAVRTFHLKDGSEVHSAFSFENDLVRDIESLTNGTPAKVNIVALEDSTTVFIPKTKMIELYAVVPSFQILGRKLLELLLISERKYTALFIDFQPKERYEFVLENHPELVQRVPLQYLASFLGVARETLSRIRKRIK